MTSSSFKSPLLKALILSSAMLVTGAMSQANAQKYKPKAEEDWITYKNERFGYKLYYPAAIYTPQSSDDVETGAVDEADDDTGDAEDGNEEGKEVENSENGNAAGTQASDASTVALLSNDGKSRIVTFAALNEDGISPDEYRKTLLDEFGGYDKLDYQPTGKSWFVLSGFRDDSIYYQKVMFSCSNRVVNVYSINFPTAEKPRYERLVEIMEDNFRTGRGTDTPANC
jgi:hypothetical protein